MKVMGTKEAVGRRSDEFKLEYITVWDTCYGILYKSILGLR